MKKTYAVGVAIAAVLVTVASCTPANVVHRQNLAEPKPGAKNLTTMPQTTVPPTQGSTKKHAKQRPVHGPTSRPNIIYVLTDDLSMDLVPYMPHVQDMKRRGATFTNFFATDSLCCPSRSSIFTGQFPHNTGVYDNTAPDGGFKAFVAHNNPTQTFASALHKEGYRTAMMGKYLNGYHPDRWFQGQRPWVNPGWDVWNVANGMGYSEYNYKLSTTNSIEKYGDKRHDYLTTVLKHKAVKFVRQTAAMDKPFMLEVATFAPHRPFTPAPRDKGKFPWLGVPRTPAFDQQVTQANKWLGAFPALTTQDTRKMDHIFRKRVRSVQAVDRMIGKLEREVWRLGLQDNTYIVFSSDNGYHLGQHNLMEGKQTAFDTDIHVPLVVVGPGVPRGHEVNEMTENIDICPTFEDLGGAPISPTADGHSLVPLLMGNHPSDWRDAVLVEHHGPDHDPRDPDHPARRSGNPPTYDAIRTKDALYVEYVTGAREYYDLRSDPWELHNRFQSMPKSLHRELAGTMDAMKKCEGAKQCWSAAHLK